MKKYVGFYIAAVTCFIIIILGIVEGGNMLQGSKTLTPMPNLDLMGQIKQLVKSNIMGGSGLFLIKLLIILGATKIFSLIFRKLGQPGVIGEILAGIVLGPSLLGMFFPEYLTFIFPKEGMDDLNMMSRLGLLLFMFIVGMELNLNKLRNKAHEALLISHAGILFPFTMGIGLAYFIYVELAPSNVYFLPFALFMGIAMGITAFPVLASILRERGMMHTPVGSLAITAAAVDDITAWCVFAGVIAIAKAGSFLGGFFTIALSVVYLYGMFKVVRPLLAKWYDKLSPNKEHNISTLVISLAVLLVSALITKTIGIHSLFGAFMAGVVMPGNLQFRKFVTERTEYVSVILLLPLFFAYSGLRTQIGLLNTPHLWMWFAVILVVAVVGKLAGTAITAKYLGQTTADSLRLGVLMNTRGLMELIVLNVGLDMGILSPEIFTMMVLMAIATTFMTGPLLNQIDRVWKKAEEPVKQETETEAVST
jgi:Kef-type K+ transport system membrane component KefB